jgi:hypothetical protein
MVSEQLTGGGSDAVQLVLLVPLAPPARLGSDGHDGSFEGKVTGLSYESSALRAFFFRFGSRGEEFDGGRGERCVMLEDAAVT